MSSILLEFSFFRDSKNSNMTLEDELTFGEGFIS